MSKQNDIHVYLSPALRKRLEALAKKECRSLTSQVLFILMKALKKETGKQ